MRVVNLHSWAGLNFSCAPGEEIELPDDVAAARLDLGLVAPVPEPVEDFAPPTPVARTRRSGPK